MSRFARFRHRVRRGARPLPGARALILAAAALSAPALIAGSAIAKDIEGDFHESWDLSAGDDLLLLHDDGDVRVTPWDRDVLDVDIRYRASFRRIGVGTEPGFTVEASREGNTIRIRTRESGSASVAVLMVETVEEYRIEIKAPAWLALDLQGDDGDVTVREWTGPIAVRLSDGDVRLEGCTAENVRVAVDDGDVRIDDCAGGFDLRTEDGNITLREVTATELRARTDDGDLKVDLLAVEELDADLRVEDGDVHVRLAPDLSVECLMRTSDGDIRVDLPGAGRVEVSEEAGYVAMGSGDGKIRIETDDGDIYLRER